MDNVNQEVPPVINQPSVKTANNSNFFRTLAYGFVVVSIGISIAVGGYLLGVNKSKPQPVTQISVPTPTPDPIKQWQKYVNIQYGFEIGYPQNFTITNNTLPKVNKETVVNQNLEISNEFVSENPKLTIWVNPLGFGLMPPDVAYELIPAEGMGVNVAVRTEVPQSQDNRNIDDETVIIGKTIKLGANTYTFQFIFKKGGKDYEPILNQILSTFKLIDTKNSDITLVSPNGGEKWTVGETHTISWIANNVKNVVISLLQGSSRSLLISLKTGVNASLQKFDWKISDGAWYVGRSDLKIVLSDAAYCSWVDESTGVECVKDELKHGDKSDNYFSIVSANLALPTTCKDEPKGVPIITSLSNYSGSIGARIEIRGCNFSGFEGDKNAWIENDQGVKGILYGEDGSTSKLLKVTLKSPLCQNNNSYSGLSCDAWLTLNTGTYNIYTFPWNKKSNEVNFTIK